MTVIPVLEIPKVSILVEMLSEMRGESRLFRECNFSMTPPKISPAVAGMHPFVYNSRLHHNLSYIDIYTYQANPQAGVSLGAKGSCRFCGRSYPEVKFSKIAHAIPEMINNKVLFAKYECDTCNHLFSKIEDDFGKMTLPDRTLMMLPKKNGFAKHRQSSTAYMKASNGLIEVEQFEGEGFVDFSKMKAGEITIKSKIQAFRPLGVYKALTKFALTVMPEQYLFNFTEALEWLQEEDLRPLPGVVNYELNWMTTTSSFHFPVVNILMRRPGSTKHQFCLFYLGFGACHFTIFLPSPARDRHLAGVRRFHYVPNFIDPKSQHHGMSFSRHDLKGCAPVRSGYITRKLVFEPGSGQHVQF